MKFTTKDIKENKVLRNFIRTRVTTSKTRLVDNYLLNVYDTKLVIGILKDKIQHHSKGTNSTKYIPQWEAHIKYLQEMENENITLTASYPPKDGTTHDLERVNVGVYVIKQKDA